MGSPLLSYEAVFILLNMGLPLFYQNHLNEIECFDIPCGNYSLWQIHQKAYINNADNEPIQIHKTIFYSQQQQQQLKYSSHRYSFSTAI